MSTVVENAAFSSALNVTKSYLKVYPAMTAEQALDFLLGVYGAFSDLVHNLRSESTLDDDAQAMTVGFGASFPVTEVALPAEAADEVTEVTEPVNEAEHLGDSDHLSEVDQVQETEAPVLPVYEPYCSIEESRANPDHLICLVDGKELKMLKRYIRRFGLTPDTYRAVFNLPADYPMTALSYSMQKAAEAKEIGLGTRENKTKALHREDEMVAA